MRLGGFTGEARAVGDARCADVLLVQMAPSPAATMAGERPREVQKRHRIDLEVVTQHARSMA
jgi:hypothetical protein